MDTKPPPGSPHTRKARFRTLLQVGGMVAGALILWLAGLDPFRSGAPQPLPPGTATPAPTVVLDPVAVAPPFSTLVAGLPSLVDPSVLTPTLRPAPDAPSPALPPSPASPPGDGSLAEPASDVLDLSPDPTPGGPPDARLEAPQEAPPTPQQDKPDAGEDLPLSPVPGADGAPDAASGGDEPHGPGEMGGEALSGAEPGAVAVGGAAGEVSPFASPLGMPPAEDGSAGRTGSEVTPFSAPLAQPPAGTEGTAPPAIEVDWAWPVRGVISQGYLDAHRAIDVDAAEGSVVGAADAGRVVYAKWETSGYGYLVIVDHDNGYVSYYAHLYGFYVDVGQTVTRGQQIGELGNTGDSTGPHLHFEIRYNGVQRNPLDLLPHR